MSLRRGRYCPKLRLDIGNKKALLGGVPVQVAEDASRVHDGLRRSHEIREWIMSDDCDYSERLCDSQEIESLLGWEDAASLWLPLPVSIGEDQTRIGEQKATYR
jgi:hypothetical protein